MLSGPFRELLEKGGYVYTDAGGRICAVLAIRASQAASPSLKLDGPFRLDSWAQVKLSRAGRCADITAPHITHAIRRDHI